MLFKIFTVYDSKVEAYLQPFFMKSKGEAIRAFTEVCLDKNSNIAKYPHDFTLFELGSYDDSNATFNMYVTPISLGLGIEYLKSVPSNSDLLDRSEIQTSMV